MSGPRRSLLYSRGVSRDDELRESFKSTGKMHAIRPPGTPPTLLHLVAELGERCLELIGEVQTSNSAQKESIHEQRTTNRLAKAAVMMLLVLIVGFVAGGWFMARASVELHRQRAEDVRDLQADIASARASLQESVGQAEHAAERAIGEARRATAESLAAQAEAAEVQARLVPPRDRAAVTRKVAEKRSAAEEERRAAASVKPLD